MKIMTVLWKLFGTLIARFEINPMLGNPTREFGAEDFPSHDDLRIRLSLFNSSESFRNYRY